jgi:hypothetical protein
MCTTREYPKKTPAIPECLTIQKQKRTNNNSSNGITGAIRDDAHGGEKERERECGRARVERRKTEALSGSHRGPKLVKWEALTESVWGARSLVGKVVLFIPCPRNLMRGCGAVGGVRE